LSLPEVDAIFSSTRLGDFPQDITRWGQVGLTGAWANRDITVYSRNAVSGTYGYFRDNALFGGDFKDSVNEQPGSSSVVQGVAESINGIGYSGIGYITSGVRAIPVGREVGGPVFEPNAENAASGDYPLSRFLYVYINKHPNEPLEPSVAEFVRMIFSQVGQEVVVRDGFIPVPASLANRVLGELGIQ
jgi:phosphate transport system substrate-binding protein